MQAAQVNTRACCHMLKLLLSNELQLNFLKSWILIFKTTAIENDMFRVKKSSAEHRSDNEEPRDLRKPDPHKTCGLVFDLEWATET